MNSIVIHQRSFTEGKVLEFDTAIDVFKILHIQTFQGVPTVWYETLKNPVHRRRVKLQYVFTNENTPDHSVYAASFEYNNEMIHVYRVLKSS